MKKSQIPELTSENNYAIIRQIDQIYGAPVVELLSNRRARIATGADGGQYQPVFHYELLTSRQNGEDLLRSINHIQGQYEEEMEDARLKLRQQQNELFERYGILPAGATALPNQKGV